MLGSEVSLSLNIHFERTSQCVHTCNTVHLRKEYYPPLYLIKTHSLQCSFHVPRSLQKYLNTGMLPSVFFLYSMASSMLLLPKGRIALKLPALLHGDQQELTVWRRDTPVTPHSKALSPLPPPTSKTEFASWFCLLPTVTGDS